MLTDIFAERYRDVRLWETFGTNERRLLVQSFQILSQDLYPFYDQSGNASESAKRDWKTLNLLLSRELGLASLSPTHYPRQVQYGNQRNTVWEAWGEMNVAKNYVLEDLSAYQDADLEIKNRLSLIELGLRQYLKTTVAYEGLQGAMTETVLSSLSRRSTALDRVVGTQMRQKIDSASDEINQRFRQAGAPLTFNNGNFQIVRDELTAQEVAQPFWQLLSDAAWSNVDVEMREAMDRRDSGINDAAFHAAKALESAIKVICHERQAVTGRENGASNYIDNLVSEARGSWLERWRGDALREIFRQVRNPLGHGAGADRPRVLTPHETDWAIGSCMVWIRFLIERHKDI